jgi:ATP-binding cassette subfamily C protein
MKRVLSRVTDRLGNLGRQTYITQLLSTALTVFTSIYPGLATVTIFAVYGFGIMSDPTKAISDADFLAFNASLAGFFATSTLIGSTYVTMISIIPMYQRLKPIMQATPEIKEDAMDPGTLEGAVEAQDIVFRYAEDLPLILDGVSLKVNQNECVAIVGRTGCGKSTLLKILLGLEKPESGSILFDGTSLENVDASLVRSQLGVVMQANHLTPGNVRSTILGMGTDKPIEIAWEAARLAKIDEEIEAMPMGMVTMVNPESVSGGQAQRLLIARALVGNPRILLLDEATSELDDESQAAVTESIMSLGTTRLIIAHRLSTIKTADRIYVLEQGKVVQEGTFEELSTKDGPFRKLVEEQML